MPYSYTPSPIYVSPVQLASDGDPASSATIMGPIEQALDNAAAMWEGGARRIRTVDDLAALRALTGMEHNEVALVASSATGGLGSLPGLYRFALGAVAFGPDTLLVQGADDGSGLWTAFDLGTRNVDYGVAALRTNRDLLVTGIDASAGSGVASITLTQAEEDPTGGILLVESGSAGPLTGGIHIARGGTIRSVTESTCTFEGAVQLLGPVALGTAADPATVTASQGTTITLEASSDPLSTPGGRLIVSAGQPSPLDQRGGIILQSGGRVFAETDGFIVIDGGKLIVATTGSSTVYGSLQIAEGGVLQLKDRIQHEVIRYSNAALNGTPIAITAATADEHILGPTPAAPTTVALADPSAVGQRVRFSRAALASSATHITVTASGVSYILSGGGGDLAWLELVSAYDDSIALTWYPSQYAVH